MAITKEYYPTYKDLKNEDLKNFVLKTFNVNIDNIERSENYISIIINGMEWLVTNPWTTGYSFAKNGNIIDQDDIKHTTEWKQFCFAKGIFPEWLVDSPFIAKGHLCGVMHDDNDKISWIPNFHIKENKYGNEINNKQY